MRTWALKCKIASKFTVLHYLTLKNNTSTLLESSSLRNDLSQDCLKSCASGGDDLQKLSTSFSMLLLCHFDTEHDHSQSLITSKTVLCHIWMKLAQKNNKGISLDRQADNK